MELWRLTLSGLVGDTNLSFIAFGLACRLRPPPEEMVEESETMVWEESESPSQEAREREGLGAVRLPLLSVRTLPRFRPFLLISMMSISPGSMASGMILDK